MTDNGAMPAPAPARFPFAFNPRFRAVALPFGIVPGRAWVEVAGDRLRARFGLARIDTPLANITCVEITGPYSWPKVVGGPRLSFADGGITFATNARQGVCVCFATPVRAGLPGLRHPGLTVTVADTEGLATLLRERTDL